MIQRAAIFLCVVCGGLVTSAATAGPLFFMYYQTEKTGWAGWGSFIWIAAYAIGSLWTHRFCTVPKPEDFWS